MPFDQTYRMLAIETALGPDAAVLTELDGEEAVSRPFLFRIRFATEKPADEVQKLLGNQVTLWFGNPQGEGALGRRPLNGRIRRLTRGVSARQGAAEWQAEVVPDVWFLSRTSDCRIFQEKSIPDIITEVLQLHGVSNFSMKVTGTHTPLEYCVQYRESALDFISRLMEQAGIFYWHEHKAGVHTLVMADENGSAPEAAFDPLPLGGSSTLASVHRLDEEYVVRSGKWAMRDFNFETPSLSLEADTPTVIDVAETKKREIYDYPGLYVDAGAGRDVTKLRMQHEEAMYLQRQGESGVAGLASGLRFKIEDLDEPEVLVTEVRHRGEDYSHWSGGMWGDREPREPFYRNGFACIPRKVPYRPPLATPKPFVRGPQTAFVVGPAGEEIHTDKHGRVKVQFHWDRQGSKDDNSSCWVRVSQGWAGKGWGQIHIPRIGHEVIVDFLEGDPDRPIITGRVYNAENTVPYDLPANKTQSGIKSNSSKGGGGSNEFRFEDKKGSEQVYFHAEKDLDSEIENNETRKVGLKGTGNRTTNIKNDETLTVGGNRKTDVTGNFRETITGSEMRTVTKAVTETFLNTETRTVTGPLTETVTNAYTITVTGGPFTLTAQAGIFLNSPAPILANSAAIINVVAPVKNTASPNWFKAGLAAGDAYQFKMGIATTKFDLTSISLGISTSLKVDISNFKIDVFNMTIKKGNLELKNASLKAETYGAKVETGVKVKN